MQIFKKLTVLAAAAAMSAMMAIPAFAYDMLDNVDIYVNGQFYIEQTDTIDDFEIYVNSDYYYVDTDSTDFTNEPEDGWTSSSKPKLKIVLNVDDEDNDRFDSLKSDDVYIYSNDFEDDQMSISVSRTNSNKTLNVTITFKNIDFDDEYAGDTDLDLDNDDLVWDESALGYAYWEGTEYARSYELRIFRNGVRVTTDTLTTTDTFYDFSEYMTDPGKYQFRVRAVHGSTTGSWAKSSYYTVSEAEAAAIAEYRPSDSNGEWRKDAAGYWWCRNDYSWPANRWEKIGGYWFFFNPEGYCVENAWVQWNSDTQQTGSGLWYYLGSDGVMLENAWTPDNYWVGTDGVWNGKDPGVQ